MRISRRRTKRPRTRSIPTTIVELRSVRSGEAQRDNKGSVSWVVVQFGIAQCVLIAHWGTLRALGDNRRKGALHRRATRSDQPISLTRYDRFQHSLNFAQGGYP